MSKTIVTGFDCTFAVGTKVVTVTQDGDGFVVKTKSGDTLRELLSFVNLDSEVCLRSIKETKSKATISLDKMGARYLLAFVANNVTPIT